MTPDERANAFVLANAGSVLMHHMVPVVRDLIAAAVAAERERCAAICDAVQLAANVEFTRTADPGAGAGGAGEAAFKIREILT